MNRVSRGTRRDGSCRSPRDNDGRAAIADDHPSNTQLT
jgi:hypothetical protein